MSKKTFVTVTTYAAAMTLGAAAHAQNQAKPGVEVYGLVDVMVRSANHTGSSTTVNDGAYTGSRLGVRGNRKMQNGFDAFFTVEMGYDPTTAPLVKLLQAPSWVKAQQVAVDCSAVKPLLA